MSIFSVKICNSPLEVQRAFDSLYSPGNAPQSFEENVRMLSLMKVTDTEEDGNSFFKSTTEQLRYRGFYTGFTHQELREDVMALATSYAKVK